MKRTSKYGLVLALVLTFTFGSIITVSARPIDHGYTYFDMIDGELMWIDNAGITWDFYIYDYYDDRIDYGYIYGFDNTENTIIFVGEFYESITSKIDYRKGIATFKSQKINITLYFDTDYGTYEITGSRKDGDLNYTYRGPGTIVGTLTFNDVVYVIDGSFKGDLGFLVEVEHDIEK